MVTVADIVGESKNTGHFKDLYGIATRAFPVFIDIKQRIDLVAEFILNYEQMWHDVGKVNGTSLVSNPEERTAKDYLETFKIFLERWAARKHERIPEENWYKAQDEFAEHIVGLTYHDNPRNLEYRYWRNSLSGTYNQNQWVSEVVNKIRSSFA